MGHMGHIDSLEQELALALVVDVELVNVLVEELALDVVLVLVLDMVLVYVEELVVGLELVQGGSLNSEK